jgi:hypothetical protein
MVTGKSGSERRKHERISLKDNIFITFRPEFDRIGWITDISKGGISLVYPIQESSALSDKLSVDIFSSPIKYSMSEVSCQLIYDDLVDNESGFTGIIETRRCGLVFCELSQHQVDQLEAMMSQSKSVGKDN